MDVVLGDDLGNQDRVGFLSRVAIRGSAFDEHEFLAERGPVLEELRRDRDDPWWRLHEALESAVFQRDHAPIAQHS